MKRNDIIILAVSSFIFLVALICFQKWNSNQEYKKRLLEMNAEQRIIESMNEEALDEQEAANHLRSAIAFQNKYGD
jgi:hypothetical protein